MRNKITCSVKMFLEVLKINSNYICFWGLKSLTGIIISIFLFLPVGFLMGMNISINIVNWFNEIVGTVYDKKGWITGNIIDPVMMTFSFLIIFALYIIISANLGNLTGYGINRIIVKIRKRAVKTMNSKELLPRQKLLDLFKINCDYLCFYGLKNLSGTIIGIFLLLPIGCFAGATMGALLGGGWCGNLMKILFEIEEGVAAKIAITYGLTIGFFIVFTIFLFIGANLGNLAGYGVSSIVKAIKQRK